MNTFDPALSVEHRFGGKLRREKKHAQDFTSLAALTSQFKEAIQLVSECYGNKAFRPSRALNAAAFEAVMVGLSARLNASKPSLDPKRFTVAYDKLFKDSAFLKACERATAREDTVEARQKLAIAAFKSI